MNAVFCYLVIELMINFGGLQQGHGGNPASIEVRTAQSALTFFIAPVIYASSF